jgi:hypothetical protein
MAQEHQKERKYSFLSEEALTCFNLGGKFDGENCYISEERLKSIDYDCDHCKDEKMVALPANLKNFGLPDDKFKALQDLEVKDFDVFYKAPNPYILPKHDGSAPAVASLFDYAEGGQQPQVYFLFHDKKLVYVGKSNIMNHRLKQHKDYRNKKSYVIFHEFSSIPVEDRAHREHLERFYEWYFEPKENEKFRSNM